MNTESRGIALVTGASRGIGKPLLIAWPLRLLR